MRFIWDYDERARELIHVIKYGPSKALSKIAGRLLSERLAVLYDSSAWDLLIPVPSSPQTAKERGFNQCFQIAKELQKKVRIPIRTDALCYSSIHRRQAVTALQKRVKNVKHAFAANDRLTAGKKVLLIDDVITTGATCASAAKKLRESGAASVDVLALARAYSWNEYSRTVAETYS
jgi:ComF family protein